MLNLGTRRSCVASFIPLQSISPLLTEQELGCGSAILDVFEKKKTLASLEFERLLGDGTVQSTV
jgi:hypothetical protein